MAGRRITAGELDARLAMLDHLVTQLGAQVAAHEIWHRDLLVGAGQSGDNRRLALWALFVSAVAAVAAVLLAVATLIR